MNSRKIRFGVNYIPSKKWLYSYQEWDSSSIAEDLHAISSVGFDHIRAHCIWPIFQPNESYVSETALDHLGELFNMADKYNLDVALSVLTGWMSGFAFIPSWQKGRNMFTDPGMIEAEMLLFEKIAERIGNHPRFLGFDMGNELSVMNFQQNPITIEEGNEWHKKMIKHCEAVAPSKFHVNGVDHLPWFKDMCFSREVLSNTGAATSLHTWILFTGAMDLYKTNEIGCTSLAEYCIELANAYSGDLNRPVWVQEFGANELWMPYKEIPDFTEKTIRSAATCKNLWGFTWWCSHDVDRRFKGFDPLEYILGVFDMNNNLKPVGQKISQLIRDFKDNPPEIQERPVALVLPDNLFKTNLVKNYHNSIEGWNFAKPYFDLMEQGIRPAVVLESRTDDKHYLRERGIKELRWI